MIFLKIQHYFPKTCYDYKKLYEGSLKSFQPQQDQQLFCREKCSAIWTGCRGNIAGKSMQNYKEAMLKNKNKKNPKKYPVSINRELYRLSMQIS